VVEQALRLGANEYFLKAQLTPAQLVDMIDKQLASK